MCDTSLGQQLRADHVTVEPRQQLLRLRKSARWQFHTQQTARETDWAKNRKREKGGGDVGRRVCNVGNVSVAKTHASSGVLLLIGSVRASGACNNGGFSASATL